VLGGRISTGRKVRSNKYIPVLERDIHQTLLPQKGAGRFVPRSDIVNRCPGSVVEHSKPINYHTDMSILANESTVSIGEQDQTQKEHKDLFCEYRRIRDPVFPQASF
jgi:hypothetical protein